MRWLVERSPDVFEDYGYEAMRVLDSGALKFWNDDWRGSLHMETDVLILAPGQWITVCEDRDAQ